MELYSRFVVFDLELLAGVGKHVKGSFTGASGAAGFAKGISPSGNLTKGIMFANNCCLFIISPEQPQLGHILWTSKNSKQVIGLARE